MSTKPIPDGYHSITPYLFIGGAAAAIEFYKRAFGAKELMRIAGPNDSVAHAEMSIGDSRFMLADEHPAMNCNGPLSIGGSPVLLSLYVPDVDSTFRQALAAGAKELRPLADQFYGDRTGTLVDPFGHLWTIGTHIEDIAPDELQRRADEVAKQYA